MEELYKVMDDLLEVEFQMKAGMDILKELEEFYMLEKETEKSEARKVAVLMKGYLQSMKSNIREIIRYIDDTTLEKSNDKKKDKQESASTISEEVQEFVNLTITEHMCKENHKLSEEKNIMQGVSDRYDRVVRVLGIETVDAAVQQDIRNEKALEEKQRMEQMPKGSIHERLAWGIKKSEMENQQRKKNKSKNREMER